MVVQLGLVLPCCASCPPQIPNGSVRWKSGKPGRRVMVMRKLCGCGFGVAVSFHLFEGYKQKTNRGGISQALMTTVLGIVVAIPTIFMHTVVKSRADNIIHILEEQATGMIAQKAEQQAAR